MKKLEDLSIKYICAWAFVLRIITLIIVMCFQQQISTGLLGSTLDQDDVRYLAGAEIYTQIADNIFDEYAIEKAFDEVEPWAGHTEGTEAWYWLVCVFYYIFRDEVFLRLINILFAVFTVKCIFDVCSHYYGPKAGVIASLLYAIMPYPVFFSCFLYKDQLYTLVTLLLIRKSIHCANKIQIKDILYLTLGIGLSMWMRSGLVVLIISIIFVIIYKEGNYKISFIKLLCGILIICIVVGYFIFLSWESILVKVYAYILEYSKEEDGIINYFIIKTPFQLYKYPFALLFLLVQPLNYEFLAKSWMGIAGILNIVGIPIALGNLFYFLNYKLEKKYFYWIIQCLYLLTIVTSLGIVRHHYYLQAFSMIFFAAYIANTRNRHLLSMFSCVSILGILLLWTRALFN